MHIRGQRFLWKLTKFFFERSWPESCLKHLKWCCWRKLRYFKLFWGKKFFSIFMIFLIFSHIWGQRFLWKLTKFFFARSWPETCPKHLKWFCWRKLRYFKLFRGKKNFFYFWWFFEFFLHIRGQRFLWKLTKFFFERSWPETCPKHLKWCCWRKLRYFKLLRGKKSFFLFFMIFWIFLHTWGHRFLWELTKFFFERPWPETCPKHLKWCCWRKLRYLKVFRAIKNFSFFDDFF